MGLILSMVGDWVAGSFGWVPANPVRRMVTGQLFGTVIGVYSAIYWNRHLKTSLEGTRSLGLTGLLSLSVLTVALGQATAHSGSSLLILIINSFSYLWFWSRANYLLILKFAPLKMRQHTRLLNVISPLILLAELALLGFLRDVFYPNISG